jgi:alpha-glucosidase
VPQEFERILRYWLDRGADGYRIDVASGLFKRQDLADRPTIRDPITGSLKPDPAFSITDQPAVHDVYRTWRAILNGYHSYRVMVGEIFEPQRQSRYILPDQLHMAFALIRSRWDAYSWERAIDADRHALHGPGLAPSWTLSNHDVVRHVTRLGGGAKGRARARAALLLLLGLPGQVFLYQGEELGLDEVDVPPEARQDPLFIHSGGKQPGRDGCRVPLPWHEGQPNAGFSSTPPWLPMPPGWDRFAVDAQAGRGDSTLCFYERVLQLRRQLTRMLPDVMTWSPAPEGTLLYERGRLTVACNFLSRPMELAARGKMLIASHPLARHRGGRLSLPGDSAAWLDSLGRP